MSNSDRSSASSLSESSSSEEIDFEAFVAPGNSLEPYQFEPEFSSSGDKNEEEQNRPAEEIHIAENRTDNLDW